MRSSNTVGTAHTAICVRSAFSPSIVTRPTIEILRQDCRAENNMLMYFFSVSDGADFSSAFVNFSHQRVLGARSMETYHREVGYFIALRPSGISWWKAFLQTKETSRGQLIHDIFFRPSSHKIFLF